MQNLLLFTVSTFFIYCHAGSCPKYPLIRDFDFKKYMGLWYQQDKKQAGWEAPGRCWKSMYWRDPKNGQFKMTMMFENTLIGREETYDSKVTLQTPDKPSIIEYTIPLTFMNDKFQVLATDYNSFSVEYKCDPNGLLEKQESVFLLTREKSPSPLVLQRAYAIMHRYGIDIRRLKRVDQTCGGMKLIDNDKRRPNLQEVTYDRPHNRHHARQEFDYYDAPEEVLQKPKRRVKPKRPPTRRRVPIVHRHPDDPTISLGSILASNLRQAIRINT